MRRIFSGKFNVKRSGMGLVEVVVAIGISVITLTGAVKFSSALAQRSQKSFVEVSASQLHTIMNEEVWLLELTMKKDKAAGFTSIFPNDTEWNNFCSTSNSFYRSFKLSIPSFSPGTISTISVQPQLIVASDNPQVKAVEGNNYTFYNMFAASNLQGYGAFSKNSQQVNITFYKNVVKSQNDISITTVVNYNIFNTDYFTPPQDIHMLYDLVCK